MFKGLKKKFASNGETGKGGEGNSPPSATVLSGSPPSGEKDKKTKRSKSGDEDPDSARGSRNSAGAKSEPAAPRQVFTKADLLKPIATFADTSAANRPQLFIHKLRLCCVMFEWHDEANTKDNRAKEVKRQQLLELVECIGNGKNKNVFSDNALSEVMQMVETNLCRALPPQNMAEEKSDEEEPVFEPSWPHLQISYEFFLRFIVSGDVDVRTLKKHITGQFVLKLLVLTDSEDHRERDYLKTILHRIYAKFMSLRAFIRKAINNVFFVFIYETERHNGIAELLEILGSIINGFALPLKDEHKSFLKQVLTPMHKVRPLSAFHQQLSYCVTQFVDKDPTLAVPVLRGLLKHWPATSSSKQVLFLNEVEELLELTQPDEFKVLLNELCHQLAKSIGGPHFQVAERALFLWHNEYIAGLFADHRAQVLPIIYPVLHVNSQSHWNPTVNNLTLNVLKIFMELDAPLVEQCSKAFADAPARKAVAKQLKSEQWKAVEDAAAKQRELNQHSVEEKS